ncbi:MAG: Dam family site-specific DNA-(adenine-N6)-methyltransferase [Muribaculaceae bacterium]|nr:Dam family site-specific DNA-(adenine-N6)-methyltransferase [Muribaculaceae bacterium]
MIEKQAILARPFVKWAGGKKQLLPQLVSCLPECLYSDEFNYIEPFVGGGAMLFFMLQKFPNIKTVIINDANPTLIDTYRFIKASPEKLIELLRSYHHEYLSLQSQQAKTDFYLRERERYNSGNAGNLEKSALFILLNRTCFNGLYRENLRGKFNVPAGKYVNPIICDEDLIYADSELLNRFDVKITCGSYQIVSNIVDFSKTNFFYFDPPYRPLNTTSNFNTYTKDAFNDASQIALSLYCRALSANDGCYWMLSNSDCSAANPSDTFFENIYSGFNIQRVVASRMINSVASKRGAVTELLITNYAPNEKSMRATGTYNNITQAI